MPDFLMLCGKEFLPLLIKRSTLRSRINGHGDDWDLMVSTVVFEVFK